MGDESLVGALAPTNCHLLAPTRNWLVRRVAGCIRGRSGVSVAVVATVRIKVCGITNARDALAAVEAGADALGFMFFEQSARHIPGGAAAAIIRELPPFIARVGVFVNPTEAAVRACIQQTGIDTLQFHGDEPPAFCRLFGLKAIKAFRVQDESSLLALPGYAQETWLLDSYMPGQLGGTGKKFNWDLARSAVRLNGRVILAGGLTPENVAEAVKQVRPYAVDVSSGVESAPGKKEMAKMSAFVAAVRSAG